MTVCNRCGKENQEHYKFCLGCGSELVARAAPPPPAAAAPPPPAAHDAENGGDPDEDDDLDEGDDSDPIDPLTSTIDSAALGEATEQRRPAPLEGQVAEPLSAAAAVTPVARARTPANMPAARAVKAEPVHEIPSPQSSHELKSCPTCGHQVPPEFVFCGQCGTRIGGDGGGKSGPASGAAPVPRAPVQAQPLARGKLVLIRPDGGEGGFHTLIDAENLVGRTDGGLFDTDTYLSPRHAVFLFRGGSLFVRDAGSLNGVFVKMTGEEEIADGEVFRMGQELLRFDVLRPPQPLDDGTEIMGSPNPGYWGRVSVIIGRGQDGAAYPLAGDATVVGRERGDILFPEDGYVSGTHARLSRRDGRFFLADLNSSNGSFLRIRGERALRTGSFLLLGQQLFRVQYT